MSWRDEVLLVCGLARCGSSMVMQMLEAGGVEVTGDWPSFEDRRAGVAGLDQDWLEQQRGRAVKLLDPQRLETLPRRARVLWMDRRIRDQARSHAKFLRLIGGVRVPYSAILKLARSLRRDRHLALMKLSRSPVLWLSFASVLLAPLSAAQQIQRFTGRELDVEAMANAVLGRPPECAPSLRLEAALIRSREGGP